MKRRNFVNLNVNPCKKCMPIGAVFAFKGIENSMLILHGSQGCSAYMRTHITQHFNEPLDIASSSLNEEGTVFGGEANLKKALRNVIKVYNPELIGIATTCLAETIGEDVPRIAADFLKEEKAANTRIVPTKTPGYSGSKYEGYFIALTSILQELSKDSKPNGKINVIVDNISPADVRNIKDILSDFGADYILLPDYSDTLDAPYREHYSKIPKGGTRIADINKMAGAAATIEIGTLMPPHISPGRYLMETYHPPLFQCPIPIGIENTDRFMNILSEITGHAIPEKYLIQRGRLIDAMIDSHKYNAQGRAVVYGEPDLVYSVSKLCIENGINPVLICTGSQNAKLKELLQKDAGGCVEAPIILDDTDFDTIHTMAVERKANLLIGNSDGKIITEKEGILPVRIGFPIHDRIGGQRLMYTGYTGSLKLLDDITNTMLQKNFSEHRTVLRDMYYKELMNAVDA